MPISLAAWMIRQAISPLFAMSIFLNILCSPRSVYLELTGYGGHLVHHGGDAARLVQRLVESVLDILLGQAAPLDAELQHYLGEHLWVVVPTLSVGFHLYAVHTLASLEERLIAVNAHAAGDRIHHQFRRPEASALPADMRGGIDEHLARVLRPAPDEVE